MTDNRAMPRILLIDDDEHLAAPLASYFSRFDFALDSASHPSEGLAKLMAAGMPFEQVIAAATVRPMAVVGLPTQGLLTPGARAELTLFDLVDSDLGIADSMGATTRLSRLIEPRWTVVGNRAVRASRHIPEPAAACPSCGGPG